MFNNKKSNAADNAGSLSSSSNINTLVDGTTMEGTINTTNDLRIDGSVVGTINCTGKLIIGPSGRVEGEVICQNAVIEGSIKGELKVHEVLDVRESAIVTGEIVTSKLLVQNGATFNGNCDMGNKLKSLKSTRTEASAS